MVKIYLDGADLAAMEATVNDSLIEGYTSNPSLLKQAAITDYAAFARDVLTIVKTKPISFEVLADDHAEMARQADKLAALAANVYVKIPITNTRRESSVPTIRALKDVKVNVTGILTTRQIEALSELPDTPRIISIFAGRIADTQVDPVPTVRYAVTRNYWRKRVQVLWASPRQVYDVLLAEKAGAHIITLTPALIAKLNLRGKDLTQFSQETVQQFFDDGNGLTL